MKTKRKSTTAVKEGQEFAKASKAGEIPAELRLTGLYVSSSESANVADGLRHLNPRSS